MGEYIRKTARYNGKKYEATGKTELEAMTKLADKLAAAKRGEESIGGTMTVNAWFRQWFELYKQEKGLTEKSMKMYVEKYSNHIKPAIGTMKIKDTKDVHLQRIMNRQAGLSDSHAKKVRIVLRGMFRRARQSRIIPYDPAERLELPDVSRGSHRSITEEERKALFKAAETHWAGLWVLTLLYTGMRPGETASLTWTDVDFDRNEIHVHTAKESGSRTVKAPKTEAGIRDLPIHSDLLWRLREARGDPFSLVFPTKAGTMQNESSMRRMWKSFQKKMEEENGPVAKDFTPYCLRHTFCTDLQNAGVQINNAKELMGHSDIQTTANIYTHRDNRALHRSIALLDGSGGKDGGTATAT